MLYRLAIPCTRPSAYIKHCVRANAALSSIDASSYNHDIESSKLIIKRTDAPKHKLPLEDLKFGKSFSDHMLEIDWDAKTGWHVPIIRKFENFSISPAASALHYGIECFEGMKAYKDSDGRVRLFRPDMNMARLNLSMERLAMPTFNAAQMIECVNQLLRIDQDWVPDQEGYSMYLRPTAIGTSPYLGVEAASHVKLYVIMSPVGPYYKSGFSPVKLFADDLNIRAWPGGVGNAKVGGNYGPTIKPSRAAALEQGCHQVLWLFGPNHEITEVGAMNIFFVIKNRDTGKVELATAPLTRGDILAGVTRDSILNIAREEVASKQSSGLMCCVDEVSERWLTMEEIITAQEEGRLLESFGAGTAVVVQPVRSILYKGKSIDIPTGDGVGPVAQHMWDRLYDIQYGRVSGGHPWSVLI